MATLSYHGDPAIKAAHIAQAEHHATADMLVSGTFGDTDAGAFKGCSVGCFAHEINPKRSDYHAVVAEAAGWPEWLVYLNDTLFEGLPAGEREQFHVELRKRVPVGVDLTPVLHEIAVARMDRLLADKIVQGDSAMVAAINGVRELHVAQTAAESAAWSEAESAAESAAWSEAESAARSAARSAAYRAERDALYLALDNAQARA